MIDCQISVDLQVKVMVVIMWRRVAMQLPYAFSCRQKRDYADIALD